jgi:uncharacterized membrane protein
MKPNFPVSQAISLSKKATFPLHDFTCGARPSARGNRPSIQPEFHRNLSSHQQSATFPCIGVQGDRAIPEFKKPFFPACNPALGSLLNLSFRLMLPNQQDTSRIYSMKAMSQPSQGALNRVLEKNIHRLLERQQAKEKGKTFEERLADRITAFAGSVRFVYLHLVVYGLWILLNLPWAPDKIRFDPTFVILAMEASVEAIFLSTFILITQNRMQAMSERRNELDLQISLLAEHEVTRVLKLVEAVARKLEVKEADDPELRELAKDVQPEDVLDQIEIAEKNTGKNT